MPQYLFEYSPNDIFSLTSLRAVIHSSVKFLPQGQVQYYLPLLFKSTECELCWLAMDGRRTGPCNVLSSSLQLLLLLLELLLHH